MHKFRMQTPALFLSVFLFIILACNNNNPRENDNQSGQGNAAGTPAAGASETKSPATDGPAIATIETNTYLVKVHKATAFMPQNSFYKVKEGHQYIVLDMSIRNKTNAPLDMGQILLMTTITDDKNTEYNSMAGIGAVAGYTTDHPGVQNQKDYDLMWGKMEAGAFHRALLLGIEAPKDSKTFTLTMPEEPDSKEPKKQAQFTL